MTGYGLLGLLIFLGIVVPLIFVLSTTSDRYKRTRASDREMDELRERRKS